jgi:hypothetical protein
MNYSENKVLQNAHEVVQRILDDMPPNKKWKVATITIPIVNEIVKI